MNASNSGRRKISDPHFHLWGPATHSWLKDKKGLANHPAGDLNSVGRDYDIHEFTAESSKYDVVKSVHVQCYHEDPLQETKTLQSIADNAATNGHPHGIIAYAELESDNIEQTLLKHMECANFRGIRQCMDFHPKHANRRLCPRDDLMTDSGLHRGLKVLAKYGLVFDLQLYPMQLFAASVMAAAHPDLRIVINHCAFPMLEEESTSGEWKRGLQLMAQHKNVFIKLSGWGIVDQKFNKEKMTFIVKTAVEIFGVDRCMFASDFPVDKVHGKYDMYWDMYIEILSELGYKESDIDKMVHRNAIDIYQLDEQRVDRNTCGSSGNRPSMTRNLFGAVLCFAIGMMVGAKLSVQKPKI